MHLEPNPAELVLCTVPRPDRGCWEHWRCAGWCSFDGVHRSRDAATADSADTGD
jgi:hypothetical protein